MIDSARHQTNLTHLTISTVLKAPNRHLCFEKTEIVRKSRAADELKGKKRNQVKEIQGHAGEASDRRNKGARLHVGAVAANAAPAVLSQHEDADYLFHLAY